MKYLVVLACAVILTQRSVCRRPRPRLQLRDSSKFGGRV